MTPDAVKARMAQFLGGEEPDLSDEARLADVVPESFLLVQLVIDLQEELDFHLAAEDLRDVVTVGDLARLCAARAARAPARPPHP
jgi:acyl carrier protein